MTTIEEFLADPQLDLEARYVAEVHKGETGWDVAMRDGADAAAKSAGGLWVESEHCSVDPQEGEPIYLVGKGLGYPIRGIMIGKLVPVTGGGVFGARVYRYRTALEARAANRICYRGGPVAPWMRSPPTARVTEDDLQMLRSIMRTWWIGVDYTWNVRRFALARPCDRCGTDHRFGPCCRRCGSLLGYSDDDGSCLGCG